MTSALTAALLLGITGGFTPGPLLTLVISQTLRHGWREGARVAAVPLITDSPLILVSLLFVRPLASMHTLLGTISLVGGAYLLWLAWQTATAPAPQLEIVEEKPQSIARGVAVNLLNPNPYMFWFTVGTPTLVEALRSGPAAAAAFLAVFFVLLVGCQMLVAAIVSHSRECILTRWYTPAMRLLGVMLAAFAVMRLRDAIDLLR